MQNASGSKAKKLLLEKKEDALEREWTLPLIQSALRSQLGAGSSSVVYLYVGVVASELSSLHPAYDLPYDLSLGRDYHKVKPRNNLT